MMQFFISHQTLAVLMVVMVTIQARFMETTKFYCNRPVELVFMLDGSESVTPAEFIQQKAFVASQAMVYDIIPGNVRLGILLYGSTVTETLGLKSAKHEHEIADRVSKLRQPSDGNNVHLGIKKIRAMMKMEARKNAIKAAVIITDGLLRDTSDTFREADECRKEGIDLYIIGVGSEVRESELLRVAKNPDHVMRVPDFGALFTLTQKLRSSLCSGSNKQPIIPNGSIVKSLIGSASSIWKILAGVSGLPVSNSTALTDSVEDVAGSITGDKKTIQKGRKVVSIPSATSHASKQTRSSSSSLLKQFFSPGKRTSVRMDVADNRNKTVFQAGTKRKENVSEKEPKLSMKSDTTSPIVSQEHSFLVSRQTYKSEPSLVKKTPDKVKFPSLQSLIGDGKPSKSKSKSNRRRKNKNLRQELALQKLESFKDLFKSFQKSRGEQRNQADAPPVSKSEQTSNSTESKQSASAKKSTLLPVSKTFFTIPSQNTGSQSTGKTDIPPMTETEAILSEKFERVFKKMVKIIKEKEASTEVEPMQAPEAAPSAATLSSTKKHVADISAIKDKTDNNNNGTDFLTFFSKFTSRSSGGRREPKPAFPSFRHKPILPSVMPSTRKESSASKTPSSPSHSRPMTSSFKPLVAPAGSKLKKQLFSLGDAALLGGVLQTLPLPGLIADASDKVKEVVEDVVNVVPETVEHVADKTKEMLEQAGDMVEKAVDVGSAAKDILETVVEKTEQPAELIEQAVENIDQMIDVVDRTGDIVETVIELITGHDTEAFDGLELRDSLKPEDFAQSMVRTDNGGFQYDATQTAPFISDLMDTNPHERVFDTIKETVSDETVVEPVRDAVETMMEYFEEKDALAQDSEQMIFIGNSQNRDVGGSSSNLGNLRPREKIMTSQTPRVQYLTFTVTGTRPYPKTDIGPINIDVKGGQNRGSPMMVSPATVAPQISGSKVTDSIALPSDEVKVKLLDTLVKSLSNKDADGSPNGRTSDEDEGRSNQGQTSGTADDVSSRWKVRLSTILTDRLQVLKDTGSSISDVAKQQVTSSIHPGATKKPKGLCSETPVDSEGEFYIQRIGNTSVTRPCPIGTRFDTELCRCNVRVPEELYIGCTSELRLNFDTSITDDSGKGTAVGDENVFLEDGAARLDGTGRLTIWRFSSAYVGPELSIRLRVKPTSKSTPPVSGSFQYLLGNCAAGSPMTYGIELNTTSQVMTFVVTTDIRERTSVEVPYNVGTWNEVELRYGGLQLTGSVNGRTALVPLGGQVKSTGAPLSVGMCDGYSTAFTGYLDDVSLHFCNPGWEKRTALFSRQQGR